MLFVMLYLSEIDLSDLRTSTFPQRVSFKVQCRNDFLKFCMRCGMQGESDIVLKFLYPKLHFRRAGN